MKKILLNLCLLFVVSGFVLADEPSATYFDFESGKPLPVITNSGATYNGVVDNPLKDDVNGSDKVGKSTTGSNAWDGITYRFDELIDLRRDTVFTMLVYHPTLAGRTRLQFNGEGGASTELKADEYYTTPGEWQLITWRIPKKWDKKFNRVLLVFAHDRSAAGEEWYFDDLKGAQTYPVLGSTLYFDFEGAVDPVLENAGATYNGKVDNPHAGEGNPSGNVGKSTTGPNGWDGIVYRFARTIDLKQDTIFTMLVYHPELAGRTRLQFNGEGELKLDEYYTTPGEWQLITWRIPKQWDEKFNRVMIVFAHDRAAAGEEWYFDELRGAPIAPPAAAPPKRYYTTKDFRKNFTGFDGARYEGVVDNPKPNHVNMEPKAAKFITGNQGWAGIHYDLPGTIDFSEHRSFVMQVYAEHTGRVRLQLEKGSDRVRFYANYSTAGEWAELKFDASNMDGEFKDEHWTRLVLIFDDETNVAGKEFFFDNIYGPQLHYSEDPTFSYFRFEDDSEPTFGTFSGGGYVGKMFNPDPDDVYGGNWAGLGITGGDTWSAVVYDLPSYINFDEHRMFKTKIYTEERDTTGTARFGDFRIELRGTPHNNDTRLLMWMNYDKPGEWMEMTLKVDSNALNYNLGLRNNFYHKIHIVFDDKRRDSGHEWYFTDLFGPALMPVYEADMLFTVTSNVEGVSKYEMEINESGERITMHNDGTHGDVTADDNIWSVSLNDLPVGQHALSIYADDELLDIGTDIPFEVPETIWLSTFNFIHNSTVNVPEVQLEMGINLFPNPAVSELTISSQTMMRNITVIDIMGRAISQTSLSDFSHTLNVTDFNRGIYFVRVTDEIGNVETSRFIKR